MHRVGVIEHDEIERIGRVAALGSSGCSVVDAASIQEAADWSGADWRRFDVVVFGVCADHTAWDRYWCVDVARTARAEHPNLRIVGLHDHLVSPLVQVRLAHAGLQRLWAARQTRTANALASLVSARRHEADGHTFGCVDVRGVVVGRKSDPAAVLDWVAAEGLTDVFDNTETQADTGLSRRAIIRVRRKITELADLSVAAGFATGGPDVDRSLPSWRSVVDYVNRARGHCGAIEAVEPARANRALQAV